MKHICPNCGFEYVGDLEKCPNCGFNVKEKKGPSEETVEQTEDIVEDSPSDNINDDIQWSEYEEMSIGSVAEILIDSLDEPVEQETAENDEEADIETEKEIEGTTEFSNSEANDPSEETDDQSDEMLEEEETETEKKDNWILSQYLQEHRHGNKTEDSSVEKETKNISKEESTDLKDGVEENEKSVNDWDSDSAEISRETDSVEEPDNTTEADSTKAEISEEDAEVSKEVTSEVTEKNSLSETTLQEAPLDPDKPYEPLDLFVLDTDETNEFSETADEIEDHSETSITSFDDPNLEPLPSEDEKVAAKYAAMRSFDEAASEHAKGPGKIPPGIPKKKSSNESNQKKPNQKTVQGSKKARAAAKKPSASRPIAKSKKGLYIGVAAAVVLLSGGGIIAYTQQQQKVAAQEARKEKEATAAAMSGLQKKMTDFYTDDSQTFIKADKANTDLTAIDDELSKFENEDGYADLRTNYQELSTKISLLEQVNNLFTEPVVNGSALKENPLLKKDEAIQVTIANDDEAFSQLLNQAIEQAKTQYDSLQNAKAKVAVVYSNGNLISGTNRTAYNEAVAAVANVKNQELVKNLTEELSQVDESLTKMEQEQEESNRQESNNTDNSSSSSNASNNGYFVGDGGALVGFTMNGQGNPIVNSNQSDINDSGNSAWIWADGVRETVIQKCLDRGYIVEGGYSLEPALIVDGNGFYNLYRTTGGERSYVVTINCKTGWFKGNGPGGPNTRVN